MYNIRLKGGGEYDPNNEETYIVGKKDQQKIIIAVSGETVDDLFSLYFSIFSIFSSNEYLLLYNIMLHH